MAILDTALGIALLVVCVQCQVGSRLKVRIGGDFVYNPAPGRLPDLLLVAGGIGINPLMAMFMHQMHLSGQARLLYSAKNTQELIFMVRMLLLSLLPGHSYMFLKLKNNVYTLQMCTISTVLLAFLEIY